MNITDVQVQILKFSGKVKASVTIIIDNAIALHDIKIIEGSNGLFVAMPDRRCSDGQFRDVAHPINQATREMLQIIILAKYEETLAEEGE